MPPLPLKLSGTGAVRLILVFLALVPAAAACASRHMWIWNSAQVIADSGEARAELFAFCDAPHGNSSKAVRTLYLYAHTELTGNPGALRSFLSDAHNRGLEVHYLDGDPDWAASDASRLYAENLLGTVLTFNQGGAPDQRFDGIQYDVEPYLLSGWNSSPAAIWNRYITLLQNCRAQVNSYNSTALPPLVFEAAIPRWYDSDESPVTSSSQVQDLTHGVVIMNYTDQASRLVADAAGELAWADSAGTRVTVGVETGDVSPEPPTVTFFDETVREMEERLAIAEAAWLLSPSYRGLAIHHYASYRSQELPVSLSGFVLE